MKNPTPLEQTAIALHDFLYDNMGLSSDWPLQVSSDSQQTIRTFTSLLNALQQEIQAAGLSTKVYDPRHA